MNYLNSVAALNAAKSISSESAAMAIANSKMRESYNLIQCEIEDLSKECDADAKHLEVMHKAASILASVSEAHTNEIIGAITDVINKALAVLFPNDPKTVEIQKSMYRDTHPHYNILLKTSTGIVRTFNQSGTGLTQVISFLFTTCLIDSRKGRKIMVMDELLNGLHPDAKEIVSSLMTALSTREHDPFQFVCVEYGMDIGKQYEVAKGNLPNALSTAQHWTGAEGYYHTLAAKGVAQADA